MLLGPRFAGACRRDACESPLGTGADAPVDLEPIGALKVPHRGLGQRANAPIDPARIRARRSQFTLQHPHLVRAVLAIAAGTARQQNRRM